MNIQPIEEIPRQVAREKFAEYRRLVRARHSAEDEALMRCYREMARGRTLIDVAEAIRGAGLGANREPRLAIARADQTEVRYRHDDACTRPTFTSVPAQSSWNDRGFMMRSDGRVIVLPPDTLPELPRPDHQRRILRAPVPAVPAALRPKPHLRNYHILFEVPRWDVELAPADPLLLRRISGVVFALVAKWDVTALEAAVLRGLR